MKSMVINIVYNWQDIDEKAFSQISERVFAKDWISEAETVWNKL